MVANNVEALRILLDCGYPTAGILATVGAVARWGVGRAILWGVGLNEVDSVGESGLAPDGTAIWGLLRGLQAWTSELA